MLTKNYLISAVSLFLIGCQFPTLSVPVCGIIKPKNNQWYFMCQITDDETKEFTLPISEPVVCTTVDGYQQIENYIDEIKNKCVR